MRPICIEAATCKTPIAAAVLGSKVVDKDIVVGSGPGLANIKEAIGMESLPAGRSTDLRRSIPTRT